jgi:hypothetical protein
MAAARKAQPGEDTAVADDKAPEYDPEREYTATNPFTGAKTKVYGTIAQALVDSGYTVA